MDENEWRWWSREQSSAIAGKNCIWESKSWRKSSFAPLFFRKKNIFARRIYFNEFHWSFPVHLKTRIATEREKTQSKRERKKRERESHQLQHFASYSWPFLFISFHLCKQNIKTYIIELFGGGKRVMLKMRAFSFAPNRSEQMPERESEWKESKAVEKTKFHSITGRERRYACVLLWMWFVIKSWRQYCIIISSLHWHVTAVNFSALFFQINAPLLRNWCRNFSFIFGIGNKPNGVPPR